MDNVDIGFLCFLTKWKIKLTGAFVLRLCWIGQIGIAGTFTD
jgi:hypothetical protein